MPDMPKLPAGYRWVVGKNSIDRITIAIQKRNILGLWWNVTKELAKSPSGYSMSLSDARNNPKWVESSARAVQNRFFNKAGVPKDNILGVYYTSESDEN